MQFSQKTFSSFLNFSFVPWETTFSPFLKRLVNLKQNSDKIIWRSTFPFFDKPLFNLSVHFSHKKVWNFWSFYIIFPKSSHSSFQQKKLRSLENAEMMFFINHDICTTGRDAFCRHKCVQENAKWHWQGILGRSFSIRRCTMELLTACGRLKRKMIRILCSNLTSLLALTLNITSKIASKIG